MQKKYWYLGFFILLVAIFFRFYLLREMPGGLFPDEAANGLDINLMEQGQLQPFYERGNGREALFFYMIWGFVKILGRSPLAHHLTSALVGTIATLGCMLVTYALFNFSYTQNKLTGKPKEEEEDSLTRELVQTQRLPEALVRQKRAIRISLLAGFLMAVSSWHVVLSRTAFRANLIPLFAGFTFYFLLRIVGAESRLRQYMWSAVAGATFALGFYTYIAYRIMVPIIFVLILWPLIVDVLTKPRLEKAKRYIPLIITAGIAFTIFIYPLGKYFYTHEGSFVGRSSQVSVFNPELNQGHLFAAIGEVTKQRIFGYFYQGDLNWRHNISGHPFLSPIISPFFGLGLILITLFAARYFFRPIRYQEDFKYFLLAGWFWGMLIPVITTAEGIPHGLRAIGTIPAVFIITAWAIYWVFTKVLKLIRTYFPARAEWKVKTVTTALYIAAVVFLVALPIQTYALYFIGAYNSPENFYSFRSDLTTVSNYLKEHGNKQNTYLVLDKFSVQTVDYLTTVNGSNPADPHNQPYVQVDPEDSWRSVEYIKDGKAMWTNGLDAGDQVVFTQSSIFDIKKFKQYHPNFQLELEARNKFGQAVLAVYKLTRSESPLTASEDPRQLISQDTVRQFNTDDTTRCREIFNQDSPNTQNTFSNPDLGILINIPFNTAWGSKRFKLAGFEYSPINRTPAGELFPATDILYFGPMGIVEACGWSRPYSMRFTEPLSATAVKDTIIENQDHELSSAPEEKAINGFTVIEWTSGGLCTIENAMVIGQKRNYLFRAPCVKGFATFEQIISTMKLVE